MRLRQVVLAAHDLDRVEERFASLLGWRVCFRDPLVGKWGLRNILLPVGDCFIEVVSPTRPETSAGRHLERIGGDGGYMLMVQVDDRAIQKARLQDMGVRPVYDSDQASYCLTQFHPADCGGVMLSWEQVLDPRGADWRVADGYWHAANGLAWRNFVSRQRAGGMRRVVMAAPDGEALARRYGRFLDLPVERAGEEWLIRLCDPGLGPDLGFVNGRQASPISRIDIEAVDPDAVEAAASAAGAAMLDGETQICGVRFRLV